MSEILQRRRATLQPFTGGSRTGICHALQNGNPRPARELNPELTPALANIIGRALEKDRNARYQTASELHADLKSAQRQLESNETVALRPRDPSYLAASLVVIFLLAIAVTRYLYSSKISITNPAEYVQLTNFFDSAVAPSLSPDGRMVTFIRGGGPFLSAGQIYVKVLPNGDAVRLTNVPDPKYAPVFTPDSSQVAYTQFLRSGDSAAFDTLIVPVRGGPPSKFLVNASGLVWIGEHRMLFSEIKYGVHMGIVTATDDRSDSRDVYLPAHARGMAHYSYLSPDRKSILLVEMN